MSRKQPNPPPNFEKPDPPTPLPRSGEKIGDLLDKLEKTIAPKCNRCERTTTIRMLNYTKDRIRETGGVVKSCGIWSFCHYCKTIQHFIMELEAEQQKIGGLEHYPCNACGEMFTGKECPSCGQLFAEDTI